MKTHSPLRDLLLASLIILVASGPRAYGQEVRHRKEINDLTPTELANLSHAFQVLRDRSTAHTDDPNGEQFWADKHGFAPPDGTGPCEHANELIYFWHRAFLVRFEKVLQDSDPPVTKDVMIPYWDWTLKPTGKRYPKAFEDQASALFHADRATADQAFPPVDPGEVDALYGLQSFADFAGKPKPLGGKGALESQIHDFVHGTYIAGDNRSTLKAARDPLFWSHHANLDRIVAIWQQKHPTNGPKCLNCALRGMNDGDTIGKFLTIGQDPCNYDYTPPSGSASSLLAAAPPTTRPKRITLAERLGLNKDQIGIAAAPQPPTTRYAAPAADIGNDRIRISFQGISAAREGSYILRVFLHPPDQYDPHSPDFETRWLLTYLTLWDPASAAHHDHNAAQQPITLDVTDRYKEIIGAAAGQALVYSLDVICFDDKGKMIKPSYGEGKDLEIKEVQIGAEKSMKPLVPAQP